MLLSQVTEGLIAIMFKEQNSEGAFIRQLIFLYNSPFILSLKGTNLSSSLKCYSGQIS